MSQLRPFELAQLVNTAELRIWEGLNGALLLCESNGRTLAELPQPRTRHGHGQGPLLAARYSEDTRTRLSPGILSRVELMELLVASHIAVHENPVGDLRLSEWSGKVLVVLRNPDQRHQGLRPSFEGHNGLGNDSADVPTAEHVQDPELAFENVQAALTEPPAQDPGREISSLGSQRVPRHSSASSQRNGLSRSPRATAAGGSSQPKPKNSKTLDQSQTNTASLNNQLEHE